MFNDLIIGLIGQLPTICSLVLSTFAVTLIYKTSATTNFAQGSIAAFGCFFIWTSAVGAGLPLWAGVLIGMVSGILLGLFIDLVIFRRGRSVNLVGKQIITMGLVTFIYNITPVIFDIKGTEVGILLENLFVGDPITFMLSGEQISIKFQNIIFVIITIAIIALLFILLRFSKWGLGVRTTASNEYVAQMMGVNTYAITAISWSIAGGLGVLAAFMYKSGSTESITGTAFMTPFQINSFLAGILGGFGTFLGPVVCAVIIPFANTFIKTIFSITGTWAWVLTYLLIMIAILIKPNGLFGKVIKKKV